MSKADQIDEATQNIRQSIIDVKSRKHCVRDFSGDVFELTPEMLVEERRFRQETAGELAGVAENILQKYAKLLSVSNKKQV